MDVISIFTVVGLAAQLCFGSRMLIQWIYSEKVKAVANPAIFWWLSILGAMLMSSYGYLREDLPIMLWQGLTYYVHIYNLRLKGELQKIPKLVIALVLLLPLALLLLVIKDFGAFVESFVTNSDIPTWLLVIGFIGQALFSLRFIYQMYYSHKHQESLLPPLFWYVSLIGAILLQIYGILRLDIVLIIGQVGGIIVYLRNIILGRRHRKSIPQQTASQQTT